MKKGIGGRKKLKFSTTEKKKKRTRMIWIAIFSVIIFAIVSASIATYVKEHPKSRSSNGQESEITVTPVAQMKEELTILFSGTKTNSKEIVFLSYITMNTVEKKFIVTCVPVTEKWQGKTFVEIYKPKNYKGTKPDDLVEAVSKKYDIKIDRYLIVTEKIFKKFIGALGPYEIDLKTRINYNGEDFTLNLLKGPQKLTAENFFKYIRFMGLGDSNYNLEKQAEVIADFLSQKISEKNMEKGDDIFSALINASENNITIVDYTKYKTFLTDISKEPRNVETSLPRVAE
ncbi:MAG: hypothetical protein GX241_06495 [Ruminococcaceae bacterium]|nr:hypothetical protein [Oscillospiraceae bacterium]